MLVAKVEIRHTRGEMCGVEVGKLEMGWVLRGICGRMIILQIYV
jgi:hypothetical protein